MIDEQAILPDVPPIDGFVARAFDPLSDYDGLADLIRDANLADGIEEIPTAEELRADYEHLAEFDPRRDIVVVEGADRLVAAASTTVRTRDGVGVHGVGGWVRPDHRRRGLGGALLDWTERRAAEVARVDDRTGERALAAWADAEQVGAIALYERAGYRIVRYGFTMLRDLDEPIDHVPVPDGLEIRPVRKADHRPIWDADVEAFADHWNHADPRPEDFDHWFAAPEIDTSLWQVAWDGDEVAGSVMPTIFPSDNEVLGIRRGWLEHVSVRRPWRRRGLASALTVRALHALRERGMSEAGLGVDAENPTGALRLYETLGFRRVRTSVGYRKAFTFD